MVRVRFDSLRSLSDPEPPRSLSEAKPSRRAPEPPRSLSEERSDESKGSWSAASRQLVEGADDADAALRRLGEPLRVALTLLAARRSSQMPVSPASAAPIASVRSRSPTYAASAGATPRRSHAMRKIAGSGLATPTSPLKTTVGMRASSPSSASARASP